MKKMTYQEMKKLFEASEEKGKHIEGVIVFTSDSWNQEYPLKARSYYVSSNNKAYKPNMGGYSIFGTSIDKTDCNVRLERYMRDEKGGKDGWKVDYCYLLDEEGQKEIDASNKWEDRIDALNDTMDSMLKLVRELEGTEYERGATGIYDRMVALKICMYSEMNEKEGGSLSVEDN